MVLYVVYRASRESKDRSVLPDRLRALGCRRVQRTLWKVDEEKVSHVLKVLGKNQPVLLRRVRKVAKAKSVKSNGFAELGSLIVVVYATPKEPKREKVRKLLRKAPCIRLCRSVYAFYQKHSLLDKDGKLVDAYAFADFIRTIREDVTVIPRVVIVNRSSVERLLEETRQRVENGLSEIMRGCQEFKQAALHGKQDDKRICDFLSRSKRRYMIMKRVACFYEKWLGIDFSKSLMRTYRSIIKVSSAVEKQAAFT